MSTGGDYPDEMFRRPLDDEAIDSLLAGRPPAGLESLVAFVEDVHLAAAVSVPEPTVALAAVFAAGLSTEKGDLPVTAAGNVPGPASQVAGLPKRSKTVIEVLLAKLAAAGLVAKTGLAAGALTLGATAAAATGNLPEPAQDRVADAVEHVGLNIPGGSEKADEHRRDADHRQEGEVADTDGAGTDVAETPAEADFGTGVADRDRKSVV